MLLSLLANSAMAASGLDIDLGYSTRVGDPYSLSYGVAASAAYRFNGGFGNLGVGASFAFYPLLGGEGCSNPRWSSLACQLLEKNSLSPLLSLETLRLGLFAQAAPFRTQLGRSGMETGLRAGFAVIHTEDDLFAMQAVDEAPDGPSHRRQSEWHPAPALGWFGSFWLGSIGGAVHFDVMPYTETFGDGGVVGTELNVVATYLEFDVHFRL